jgi:hypothetical protein
VTRLRVLVGGRLVGVDAQGGASWAVLQYLLGLARLGHDVTFVEPVGATFDHAYARAVVARFGLSGKVALVADGRRVVLGPPYPEIQRGRFDLLVNLSGVLRDAELVQPVPVRLYVDLDPAFTQVWHERDGLDVGLAGHTHYATVGLRVGDPDGAVPSCGVEWIRTLPPVDIDAFAPWSAPCRRGWTTVGNWRSYGTAGLDSVRLGQRAHSMRKLFGVPRLLGRPVSAALAIDPSERADLDGLVSGGWELVDPYAAAGTPDRYREFVAGSRGELCVAKEGYVVTSCGWFSDRSACYLACGRPVVAQDTGFAAGLPCGKGLLAYATDAEAADAIARVEGDYRRHAAAARELACGHLAAGPVLRRLVQRVGLA